MSSDYPRLSPVQFVSSVSIRTVRFISDRWQQRGISSSGYDAIMACRGCHSALLVSAILLRGVPLAGQLPSNATLQGNYYFRYLGVNSSPVDKARSALGTLSFDGNGKVQVTGQQINN